MVDENNVAWGFNSMAVRRTISFFGEDGKIKSGIYSKSGLTAGFEMLYPFDGFIGWNLAVVVWDPDDDDELSATLDGDIDMYINPGSARFPTLADARGNRWYEGTDDAGGPFTLQGHIMTVLGGRPNYLTSPYPGTYEIKDGFNGMIAEVVIYSQALVECEIQPMVDYLQAKYNCGTTPPLLEIPNPSDCRYYNQRGNNISDFNADCKVDFTDYGIMADKWLSTY